MHFNKQKNNLNNNKIIYHDVAFMIINNNENGLSNIKIAKIKIKDTKLI